MPVMVVIDEMLRAFNPVSAFFPLFFTIHTDIVSDSDTVTILMLPSNILLSTLRVHAMQIDLSTLGTKTKLKQIQMKSN